MRHLLLVRTFEAEGLTHLALLAASLSPTRLPVLERGESWPMSDLLIDKTRSAAFIHLRKGSGLAGFIGKMSEISWIQRIHDHVGDKALTFIFEMPSAQLDQTAENTELMSYFVD